jgi:hypothetical protein
VGVFLVDGERLVGIMLHSSPANLSRMRASPEMSVEEQNGLIQGVFSYLEATLPAVDLAAAAEPQGVGTATREYYHSLRWRIAERVKDTFRLQSRDCPLQKLLDGYRLYHRDDMADALAAAFCLHRAGKDPVEALTADYVLGYSGLLTWGDFKEEREKANNKDEFSLYWHFKQFYKEGDRLVHYSTPGGTGAILVRGDRRVWEVSLLHIKRMGVDLVFKAAMDHFEELGGNAGFFSGKFTWPPEGWVNPVAESERAKAKAEEGEKRE